MANLQNGILVLFVILCEISLCYLYTVYTKGGVIIGSTKKTRKGRKVSSFRGIPFAEPPVDELRFQDPVPVKPWKGVIYATEDGSGCVQRGNLSLSDPLTIKGDEDCLYLNVYTPYLENSTYTKLPVMAFTYGGGWVTGSNHRGLYGPDYLLDRNVILVVFNYRIDVFGFFSTGDQLAPGNFGLKDQVLALKWINQNIQYFGGDPAQVTVFGESVGGVSVNSFFYSDLTIGLFQRAISISGTVDMPVAHLPVERVAGSTKQLAELVGCPSSPSTALLKCMQTIPPKELIEKQILLTPEGFPPFVVMSWIPVYDYLISPNPFFPTDPRKTSFQPVYPWINGATTYDGTYFVCHIFSYPDFVSRLEANPRKYLPELLYLSAYLPEEAVPAVTDRIVNFYFGNQTVNQTALVNLMTDAFFFIPAVTQSLKHGGPVHYYEYAYPLPQTWNNRYGPPGVVKPRPGHSDILLNLFEITELFQRTDSPTDVHVSERLVEIFTNFAITGNPTSGDGTVRWDVIGTEEDFNYLYIGKEFVQKQNPYPERVAFWRSLQREYPDLY